MARTTTTQVEGILGINMIPGSDLRPWVETAAIFVNNVVACAAKKGITLPAATLEMIERWMAASYYTRMDPLYTSKSTLGGSGSFSRRHPGGRAGDEDDYADAAADLDPSGCTSAILRRARASGTWLGKTKAEALTFDQRNNSGTE
jgi:hypothetical protein